MYRAELALGAAVQRLKRFRYQSGLLVSSSINYDSILTVNGLVFPLRAANSSITIISLAEPSAEPVVVL